MQSSHMLPCLLYFLALMTMLHVTCYLGMVALPSFNVHIILDMDVTYPFFKILEWHQVLCAFLLEWVTCHFSVCVCYSFGVHDFGCVHKFFFQTAIIQKTAIQTSTVTVSFRSIPKVLIFIVSEATITNSKSVSIEDPSVFVWVWEIIVY